MCSQFAPIGLTQSSQSANSPPPMTVSQCQGTGTSVLSSISPVVQVPSTPHPSCSPVSSIPPRPVVLAVPMYYPVVPHMHRCLSPIEYPLHHPPHPLNTQLQWSHGLLEIFLNAMQCGIGHFSGFRSLVIAFNRLYATSRSHLQWPNPSSSGHTIWCRRSEMYLLFKAYLSSRENCICSESQILICSGQFHTPYNLRFGTKKQHFTFYGWENIKFIPNLILLSRLLVNGNCGCLSQPGINVTFCNNVSED